MKNKAFAVVVILLLSSVLLNIVLLTGSNKGEIINTTGTYGYDSDNNHYSLVLTDENEYYWIINGDIIVKGKYENVNDIYYSFDDGRYTGDTIEGGFVLIDKNASYELVKQSDSIILPGKSE